ncbi:MAG: TetR/AcrR family transcriptional regulator [Actinobacteria bacterium]|nr:TetR/AcrR family transcriptional regulator [Actinomycetota bacterium]
MAKKSTPSKRTTGKNPRTTRIRDIVLQAVIELLVAEGAGAVTALRVSEHAGVARSTIYQHWPDQNNLLLDAIDRIMIPDVPTSITNNLEEDLTTALANLRRRMTKQPFRALFATLLDHANRDKAFVAPQRRFVNGVLQPIREILTAATQRGDLPSVDDVDETAAQLAGPLFTQHIMLRTTISDQLIANTTEHFLANVQDAKANRHVKGS